MSIKQYILFLSCGTALATCAWIIVILNINPATSGFFGFFSFYSTLFIVLTGFFATIATLIRIYRGKHITIESMISTSLRQGLLLSVLIEIALILLAFEYLSTMMLILLVIVVSIIEFVFLSFDRDTHKG